MITDTLENTMILVYSNRVNIKKEYEKDFIDAISFRANIKEKIIIRYDDTTIKKKIVDDLKIILEDALFEHLLIETKIVIEKMNNDIDHYLLSPLSGNAQQILIVYLEQFNKSEHKNSFQKKVADESLAIYL
jgi:hypothetical protein